jgi:hypothetical protein
VIIRATTIATTKKIKQDTTFVQRAFIITTSAVSWEACATPVGRLKKPLPEKRF